MGDLLRKSAIARFSHNTGLLLQSGVVLLDSLTVTAGTTGNKVLEQAILDTRAGLEKGLTLSELLAATGLFPALVCHMVGGGRKHRRPRRDAQPRGGVLRGRRWTGRWHG